MDVKNLIQKLKNGEEQAYKELVFSYSKRLMSVARLYAKSYAEAQDNLQDTFVVIFSKVKEFKGKEEAQLYAWMKQILIFRSLTKSQKKYKKMESSLDEDIPYTTIEADAISQINHQEIINLVYSLPDGYKQVFALYAIEGFSHREIGEQMGIAESSSRSQYSRAKKILQNKINELSKVYS